MTQGDLYIKWTLSVAPHVILVGATMELAHMAIVIVNLETRYLPDGSLHMSSPDVPGFHVVDHERKRTQLQFFVETALPLLQETISRRVAEAKIGERAEVRWQDILDVKSVVPAELGRARTRREKMLGIPRQLIAEIH